MDSQLEDVARPVLIDVIVFCILGLFDLYVAKIAKPMKRGFYCNDESIRYPRHDSTVPAIALNIVGISVPLILILLLEFKDSRGKKRSGPVCRIGKHKVSAFYWNVYRMVACYACGAIFCQTLTDIGKKLIGRLRPNFMSVCQPKNLEQLCNATQISYIMDLECSSEESVVNESRVSFPSGHSSFSFYVAVFIALYLQRKIKTRTILAKPIVQFLFIAVAWTVALSRVMDNKHHWSDVLSGILLGTIVCVINAVFIHRILKPDENSLPANGSINGIRTTNVHEAHAQV